MSAGIQRQPEGKGSAEWIQFRVMHRMHRSVSDAKAQLANRLVLHGKVFLSARLKQKALRKGRSYLHARLTDLSADSLSSCAIKPRIHWLKWCDLHFCRRGPQTREREW
ncbi:hypothetical protein TWF225_011211 [Orbilia oligospora]|nr:hypothetical protein TWF225_011211 [Orbilia oligospora]KAF3248216.1 hypothetical protein TWF217_009187 [Orbilia oligospora]KAF3250403.1 hypothetical protein TWF128_007551 [Orbilia oligospora]KAF3285053.1 hypothetical protein TWF132_009601 [Orbilia oligospora]